MEPKDVPYLLLGAMSTIREETKKTVDELVDKGKKGSGRGAKGLAQADRVVKDLVEKGKKDREDLLSAIGKEVTRILDNMGAITKNDIRSLEKKLVRIEKKIK
ncbi:MAG: phasin family protein [Actinobacteria bacterium]|nr:phasin family protein [Actinomycetota bacterium]MBU4240346.1 phasin family protein [Actinomycetota bacterium]MBU4385968.1 phasin family protein [Actinomycetota bacterium]MBU4489735.1 phasin family protein [Actinomycetota bacterium]MCG2794406.1 phasin family protein [Actinomycetes bacterium]